VSLKIQVTPEYLITSDTLNIIVKRKYIVDPTKAPNWKQRESEGASPALHEEWRDLSYHRTIEQALRFIADQRIRDSDAESIGELLDEIKAFHREITAVLGG
jgi:hypothetical protein